MNVRIADDTSMKNLLFAPDDELAEVVSDSFETQASGKFSVAVGGTESLSFGDVTHVKGFFIKCDGDAEVNVNALGVIQLRKHDTTTGTEVKIMMEADISSLAITNNTTAVITGVWCVWGNYTA
jgi:hypothetical protein